MTLRTRLAATYIVVLLCVPEAFGQRLVPPPPGGNYCQSTELCQVYRNIYFANSGFGYAASAKSLLRTSDAGGTWVPLIGSVAGRQVSIREMFFLNDATFFVYGNEFLRTTDRGTTFTQISLTAPVLDKPNVLDTVRDGFFFLDSQRGWALGNQQFLFTYDGGQTWGAERMRIAQPRQLWMLDERRGIAVRPQVARTEDGGKTWQPVLGSPQIDHVRCNAMEFCVGWRGLDVSKIQITSNGGISWQTVETGLARDMDSANDFQIVGSNEIVVVGTHTDRGLSSIEPLIGTGTPIPEPPPRRALLLRWDGSTWHRTEYPEIETLWTVHYVTPTDVWASADTNGILHSTDGAQTWTFVPDYYRQIAALTPSPAPFVVPTP